MDNKTVNIASSGMSHLKMAIEIACNHKCIGYKIVNVFNDRTISNNTNDTPVMILYWTDTGVNDIIRFPYQMDTNQMTNFVIGWLDSINPKFYFADIDGDTGKGFNAFTDPHWDMVFGQWQAMIAIMPIPAMYGK